jgi:hypothetical protein
VVGGFGSFDMSCHRKEFGDDGLCGMLSERLRNEQVDILLERADIGRYVLTAEILRLN